MDKQKTSLCTQFSLLWNSTNGDWCSFQWKNSVSFWQRKKFNAPYLVIFFGSLLYIFPAFLCLKWKACTITQLSCSFFSLLLKFCSVKSKTCPLALLLFQLSATYTSLSIPNHYRLSRHNMVRSCSSNLVVGLPLWCLHHLLLKNVSPRMT